MTEFNTEKTGKVILVLMILGILFLSSSVNLAIIDPNSFDNATLDVNITDSISSDFYLNVAEGNIEGYTLVHKFGATLLDVSMHPIAQGTHYRTPKEAKSLEFVSDNSGDSISGLGAREITIIGLSGNWTELTQIISTNGTTAVEIPIPLTRLYRWYVSKSGKYANETDGSHIGNLQIREMGGGDLWSSILNTPFPTGQSQIGIYTCEVGKTAYLLTKTIFVDSSKTADLYFFRRDNINDTTASYEGSMRLIEREVGVQGGYDIVMKSPKKICDCPCDLGFMGKISVGTSEASVEFELLLVDN